MTNKEPGTIERYEEELHDAANISYLISNGRQRNELFETPAKGYFWIVRKHEGAETALISFIERYVINHTMDDIYGRLEEYVFKHYGDELAIEECQNVVNALKEARTRYREEYDRNNASLKRLEELMQNDGSN